MKFLIFLSLTFSSPVFAKTFEEVTDGWNCINNVEIGGKGKSIITGDFCVNGTYNIIGVEQPTAGQIATRTKISDNGDVLSKGPDGEGYVVGSAERQGCGIQGTFSLNHCAIYNSIDLELPVEIVIQGPLMVREEGVWMSPAVFSFQDTSRALQPLNGKTPRMGLVGRLFLKVEDSGGEDILVGSDQAGG